MSYTMFHKSKKKIIKSKKRFIKSSIILILVEYLYILTCLRTGIFDTFLFQIPILFLYYKINFIKKTNKQKNHYTKINFIRKRKGTFLLFLFILPYTSILIEDKIKINSREQNINYTFWVELQNVPTTDDKLNELKSKNVDFLIPINTGTLKDIGYYYSGNESFSYEEVGEEKNIKWVDSSKIYGNCTIKIIDNWENHGNVLELHDDGGIGDFYYVEHNYNTNLIGKVFEFWIGMEKSNGIYVTFSNSEKVIERLGFSPIDIWCRINRTHSGIIFKNIITRDNFLHVKFYLMNESFDLFIDNNYMGTRNYSCLYDDYKPSTIDCVRLSTSSFHRGTTFFDAIGVSGIDDYREGENINPYKYSKKIYSKLQRLNRLSLIHI